MANLSDNKVRLVIFIFTDFKITLKVTRNHARAVQCMPRWGVLSVSYIKRWEKYKLPS